MAEDVHLLRRATVMAVRDSAIHRDDATILSAQNKAQGRGSDLFALPCATDWTPIQDLDPASGTYGLFYRSPDYGDTATTPGTTPGP